MTDHTGRTRVVVLDDLEHVALQAADWSRLGPRVAVEALGEHLDGDALVAALTGADVVVCMRERTPFPRALVERLPGLRLLVTTGARNAAVDLAACRDHGVVVCGTSGGSPAVVEHAWALVLAAARDLPGRAASMRRGAWAPTAGFDLAGKTLGLVGLGRTGSRMAAIGAAFGMHVVAWSENLTDARAAECGAVRVGRAELFATSDVVSLHVLLSDRTRGLVGEPELRAMKPTAWLVNTSRGPVVDEAVLVQALRERWLAGAAVDVFGTEPLPADHPLRALPNTILTPHTGYVTLETFRGWYADVVEDVAAWLAGSPLRVLE
jgi:phosphoglycerate dehydrogenase-like enzyme